MAESVALLEGGILELEQRRDEDVTVILCFCRCVAIEIWQPSVHIWVFVAELVEIMKRILMNDYEIYILKASLEFRQISTLWNNDFSFIDIQEVRLVHYR